MMNDRGGQTKTSFFMYSFNKYLLRGFYVLSFGAKAHNVTDAIPES